MKKWSFVLPFILLISISMLLPAGASAYSYGDPNEEAVAEVYKNMAAKLNASPPDFAGAKGFFDTIVEELDMHMGTEPAQSVNQALEEKNKDAVLDDMHKILVLNIARRLSSIEKDFQNYTANKTLIAKANATYEALSPLVKQADAPLDAKMRGDFDKALQTLGNPGLFGVGSQPADLPGFQAAQKDILDSLQKQFNLASVEVGHFADGQSPGNKADRGQAGAADLSAAKNWVPIAVIVLVLAAVVVYVLLRRRK